MSILFISHSSGDREVTLEVAKQLRKAGHESFFLDIDPDRGIEAGQQWERELYNNVRACRAVIVLWSDAWAASSWCFAEAALARMHGKTLITLRVDPDGTKRMPSILKIEQNADARTDRERGFKELISGLEQAGIRGGSERDWKPSDPPYPGLATFTAGQASIYFGRSKDTRAALDRLESQRRVGSPRLLLVLGPSGSGKSSMLRAGVLPQLTRAPTEWRIIGPFRPDREPLTNLALALADAFEGKRREIEARLRASGDLVEVIRDLTLDGARERREATPLIVIDQLEEALTGNAAANASFLGLLGDALAHENGPLAIATLRSDFLATLQQSPTLGRIEPKLSPLGPLRAEDLRDIIEGPARLGRIDVEPRLTKLLADAVDGPAALPLLAFTLRKLWDLHHEKKKLTVEQYREFDGLAGAVAEDAEQLFRKACREAKVENPEAVLRRAFLELARPREDGGGFTRRPAKRKDFAPQAPALLEHFVKGRLLVARAELAEQTSDDPAPRAAAAGDTVYEVAHEAIFDAWERLRGWLEDAGGDLYRRRRLERAVGEWLESGRRADFLWSDERAMETRAALDRLGVRPPAAAAEFLGPTRRAEMEQLLADPATPHATRQTIGARLQILGDDRPGVGLDAEGVPAPAWCAIAGGTVTSYFEGANIATYFHGYEAGSYNDALPPGHREIEEVERPLQPASPEREGAEPEGYFGDGESQHGIRVTLGAYDIAKTPVTWRQFAAFTGADDYASDEWWEGLARPNQPLARPAQLSDNEPVTSLTWFEATAFTRWLSARRGEEVHLPSVWEWELAARGSDDSRRYPWGDEWDPRHANTIENGLGRATAVGLYPAGASPAGVLDMSGNVWEWCIGAAESGEVTLRADLARAIRGGSWNHVHGNAATDHHNQDPPAQRYFHLGFRLLRRR